MAEKESASISTPKPQKQSSQLPAEGAGVLEPNVASLELLVPVVLKLILSLMPVLRSDGVRGVLGGRDTYGWKTGEMRLNGAPYKPHSMRHLLGYVPQAHLVFKELTVYENLAYSAMLRLRRTDNTPHYRHELIESALDLLGLQPCRHFVCDPSIGERLSGGQMRRIGIGIELACDPPMMLLDEAAHQRLVVEQIRAPHKMSAKLHE